MNFGGWPHRERRAKSLNAGAVSPGAGPPIENKLRLRMRSHCRERHGCFEIRCELSRLLRCVVELVLGFKGEPVAFLEDVVDLVDAALAKARRLAEAQG